MTDFGEEKTGLSGFSKFVIVLIAVAIALVLFYVFSARNASRYTLKLEDNLLEVHKGWFFPYGLGRYEPEDRRFIPAYEPIPLPEGSALPADAEYKEVAELDAALLDYLLDVCRGLVSKGQREDFDAALRVLARAERLPALTPEQQLTLRGVRADVFYAQGKIILQKVADELRKVLEHFREAKKSAPGKYQDVDHWISLLELKIHSIEAGTAPTDLPTMDETPAAAEAPALAPPPVPAPTPTPAPAPAPRAKAAPAAPKVAPKISPKATPKAAPEAAPAAPPKPAPDEAKSSEVL